MTINHSQSGAALQDLASQGEDDHEKQITRNWPSADWDRSRPQNQDVWRERNAEYDPQNIISTVKHGSGIIMIFPAKGTE